IGGTSAGAGNLIAHNAKGVVVAGASSVGDSIQGNGIYANTTIGIDLGDDGPTVGAAAATGPNDLQARPVLTSVSGGQAVGFLNGAVNTSYEIEFFATPMSGGGLEGETFLGSAQVMTDGAGVAAFSQTVSPPSGWIVSATATNLTTGDTSEFSPGPPVA